MVLGLLSFAAPIFFNIKAAEATRDATAAEDRRQALQLAGLKRKARREGRVERARILQASVNAGAGTGSSAVISATGSVASQTATSLSFLDSIDALNKRRSEATGRAQSALLASTAITSVRNLAVSAFTSGLANQGFTPTSTNVARPPGFIGP